MLRTGLEFAPGTADETRHLIARLFTPEDLLGAYRLGVGSYSTRDIVLVAAAHDPEIISPWPRSKYIESALGRNGVQQLSTITLSQKSAQQIARLPASSDAFWLVLEIRGAQFPSMTVIFPQEYEADDSPTLIG